MGERLQYLAVWLKPIPPGLPAASHRATSHPHHLKPPDREALQTPETYPKWLVKSHNIALLGSRLYTRNLKDPPERIVLRNLWPLVAAYLPGALIADRTALESRPAPDGSVFLVADHKRDIVLPGATLRPRKGAPPLASDRPFVGGLRLASPARAFLENMRWSRAR